MLNPACLSALLLAGLLQAPPVEPGWTSLFNGKDFSGWKISKPESFTIADGAIAANGVASHAYYDGPFQPLSELRLNGSDDHPRTAASMSSPIRSHWRQRPHLLIFFKGFEIQVNTVPRPHPDRHPVPRQT